jgi:hypothetical protein
MLAPPSLTILPLSIAAVVTTNVAGLVSTVGTVAAATGCANPAKADATTIRTIAMPMTLPGIFFFTISQPP